MKNTHFLWISLSGKLKNNLQKIINTLADEYHTPKFEPHLTLLGGIKLDTETVIQKAKNLVSRLEPFQIELGNVSFSTTYFQSVFVRVKASAELMQANLTAKEIFEQENDVFMPHISLLYGNQDMSLREKIVSKISLPKTKIFKANKILIPAGTSDPKDWSLAAEIPLGD